MKKLLAKTFNLQAPGGNNYEWKSVRIQILIDEIGWHLLKITASAKNAKQKNSTDDDDLRMSINGYRLGKYEFHGGKEHYKGFDSASTWNGATLKGNTKSIFLFFYTTRLGNNQLEFYADGNPFLKDLELYRIQEDGLISLAKLNPPQAVDVDQKGIPWMSLVFVGPAPKKFEIEASAKSGKQKNGADGDSLKVILNGKIFQNEEAPTSDKYKNFYFSGDQLQGTSKTLIIGKENMASLENSVELWYDQNPTVNLFKIELSEYYRNFSELSNSSLQKDLVYLSFHSIAHFLKYTGRRYTSEFITNSISSNPQNLSFGNRSQFTKMIKGNNGYQKVIEIVKKSIANGKLINEIHTGTTPEDMVYCPKIRPFTI